MATDPGGVKAGRVVVTDPGGVKAGRVVVTDPEGVMVMVIRRSGGVMVEE